MFTIARATENDVDAIKKVLSATWVDTYASYLSPSTIEQVTTEWHAPKLLRSQIERDTNYFAVAWLDGEVFRIGEGNASSRWGRARSRLAQTTFLSSPWSGNWSRSH